MTVATTRIGVFGDWTDPAMQLMEDALSDQNAELVVIDDPLADAAAIDRLIVLSQAWALAHFAALVRSGLDVTILLRRHGASVDLPAWRQGLDWLAAGIETAAPTQWRFAALTPEAAEVLSSIIRQAVDALPALPEIAGERPVLPLDRRQEVATFSQATPDGRRESRRVHPEFFNWVRLRRLARLRAADADDADLADLVSYANGVPGAAPVLPRARPSQLCILSVVPNGVGLGHVTRMMSVGRALQEECGARVIFWSFSRAAEIIHAAGFEVILRQTALHLSAHPPDWRHWETLEFADALRHFRPNVITYDGGTFDVFMIDALRQAGCGRAGVAWIRRGMLQPESDAQLLESEEYCDVVLEPGDIAIERDQGPTRLRQAQFKGFSRYHYAAPVTLKPFLATYPRRVAKRRLDLGRGRHCLVSLGGAFGDWEELQRLIELHAARRRITLIWAKSPLAPAPAKTAKGTKIRQLYPLGSYLPAFDGVISAAGYNSYHELMLGYDGPVLMTPTNNDRLDDQVARATHAAEKGWCDLYLVGSPENQEHVVARFMDRVRSGEKITHRPPEHFGCSEMAREIRAVAARYV
ncbi:Glycosyltransferase [Rhodovulum sp. P5]|uniref:hypothetical protein n=1 Tax=Rhodovulum sp. P5 TaxID=1564506 RepID=UPI0009C22B8B|nr:hypothetical protein [Rhodovulum sp. P5]ARE41237.1 Glycosyltransferase [Rhodovulum sp. P5]